MTEPSVLEELREWLRQQDDYDVQIDLLGLYGTIHISVTHLGREIWWNRGMDFEKRLQLALEFLKSRKEAQPGEDTTSPLRI